MSDMRLYGLYILKDDYFTLMNDDYIKQNDEENRPFYYCVKETTAETVLYWMIPLSSQVEKYKDLIKTRKREHKPCDGLYICKLPTGKESAFLIQDVIPVTKDFIEREYTLAGKHMVLPYEKDIKEIDKRARKTIRLVRRGVKFTPTSPNVPVILNILLHHSSKS